MDPTEALTVETRRAPGRNTIWPSVTVPVWVWPSEACQRSTAAVVAESKCSSTVIAWPVSKPSATRFRSSSWTSGPSPTPADSVRYAGVVPSIRTIGRVVDGEEDAAGPRDRPGGGE